MTDVVGSRVIRRDSYISLSSLGEGNCIVSLLFFAPI